MIALICGPRRGKFMETENSSEVTGAESGGLLLNGGGIFV